MNLFCIADEETARGFRLAGIGARAVDTAGAAAAALQEAAAQPGTGMVVITQPVADTIREVVDTLRLERPWPLIVEIPGPAGWVPGHRSLRQLAQTAVGLRLG